MLRRLLVLALAAAGCSSESLVVPDARFVSRDAVVDPRDATDAPEELAADVTPTVDVTVFDGSLDASAPADARDASATGDAAADLSVVDAVLPLDAPATPCTDLAERYAMAVRAAQTCGTSSECGARVCETLCCACQVFVSAQGDRVRLLDDLRSSAERLGCSAMLRCPPSPCPAALSGACSSDGRCVTLREAPSDAGADR